MKILAYGQLGEVIGRETEWTWAPEIQTVADLRQALVRRHPEAQEALASSRSRACIDDIMVGEDHVVSAEQVIEFLPPLSGG